MKKLSLLYIIGILTMLASCVEDENYSTSTFDLLSFSTDTVKLDTTFSNVPTSTRSFWVYNKTGKGLHNISVLLENRNQIGYRVNVDGSYLGETSGYQIQNIEVRNGDSIRVFVELTSHVQNQSAPKKVEDNLIFTLESGVQQKINLNAYSWDAILLNGLEVKNDTTISSEKPIVLKKDIVVDSAAHLTIDGGTTLYFHQNAGIKVYGSLTCNGTADKNVILRGDRLDNMFDYLPYNFAPGQWQGITFHKSSYDNDITFTDIHSTYNGIVCDSSDITRSTLLLKQSTVHNCQGYGLYLENSQVDIENSQITNTLNDCLAVVGGDVSVMNSTLAQFYPFDAARGTAILFSNIHPLTDLTVSNSLITGYADDVMQGVLKDSTVTFNYSFNNCIIRTPKLTTKDSVNFVNVIFEDIKDTTCCGYKNFKKINTDNLRYDFHLDSISPAIDAGDKATSLLYDHDGILRDDKPDIGCYEYKK